MMKQYCKLLIGAMCFTAFASCADNSQLDFTASEPESLANLDYLKKYDVLKNYVNRTTDPNFKLGTGVTVSDFNAKGMVYALTVSNFDEMTAGNAMKYASCVGNDGKMSFSTVTSFVKTASEAGLSIYGHTLAWHSQQNNTYLNSLVPECNRFLHITTSAAKTNVWDWNIAYNLDAPLTQGVKYTFSFKAKASSSMTLCFWPNCTAGTQYLDKFTIGTKWNTYSITFTASNPHNILSLEFGTFGGDLYLDDFSLVADGSSDNLMVNSGFDKEDL